MGTHLDFNDIDIYSVLSRLHEGVVISDHTGRVIFFNEGQSKIDDFTPEEALGKKMTELYQLDDSTSPTMRCLATGRPIINETLVYQTRLGRKSNIISNVYPLYKNDRLIGAINFSKDYQHLEEIAVSPAPPAAGGGRARTGNGTRFSFQNIIASSEDMLDAIRIAQMASSSPSPIMISGETGTGKEMFAQAIHNHSKRAKKPFIPVNCAAIPENLLEGILFGTSKGSFTGAIDKRGLFEQADGGSIFLDELDSMPLTLQVKLLRVIQEKKVRKLGSLIEKDLDVKIISSVALPPLEVIQKGLLRMDLFYRMGVVSIILPPLRERAGEVEPLISHFISVCNGTLGKRVTSISPRVTDLLLNYHWPGNVRELAHIIEAAMNMVAEGHTIRLHHLPPHIFTFSRNKSRAPETDAGGNHPLSASPLTSGAEGSLFEAQAATEMHMICSALEKTRGNAAKAARSLGISPQAFHYKLKKYRIDRKAFAGAR